MESLNVMLMGRKGHGVWQQYLEQVLSVKFPETYPWRTWQGVGTVLGLTGGLVSAVFGSLLTAVSWFVGAGGPGWYVQRFGTVLLLATVPLLLCGAHCLDLLERRKRRGK